MASSALITATEVGRKPVEKYVVLRRLGRVKDTDAHTQLAEPRLYLVRRPSDQRQLVEKMMPTGTDRQVLHLAEIRIHITLRHRNILEYVDGLIRFLSPPLVCFDDNDTYDDDDNDDYEDGNYRDANSKDDRRNGGR
jgi:hypothetical protein